MKKNTLILFYNLSNLRFTPTIILLMCLYSIHSNAQVENLILNDAGVLDFKAIEERTMRLRAYGGPFLSGPSITMNRVNPFAGFGEESLRLGIDNGATHGQLLLNSFNSVSSIENANNNSASSAFPYDMISLVEYTDEAFGSNTTIDFTWHIGLIDQLEFSGGVGGLDGYDANYLYSFGSDGDFQTASDKSLKSDIKDLDKSLQKINKLSPKTYNYIWNKESKKESVGFLAQDLGKLFPELVSSITQPNGEQTLMVNYIGLIPHLTKGLQEQQETIISNKNRMQDMQHLISQLASKINRLEEQLENK